MTWSGIGGPPAQWRRAWRVRIALAGSPLIVDIIDTAEPYLADALLAAITEAERRGFHERGSVPSPNAGP